jgi:putative oxidoreductase
MGMAITNEGMATDTMQSWALLIARISVAPLFLYSGIGKVMAFSATAARLPGGAEGFGRFMAAGSIVVELGCALALIFGLFTRWVALVLILFTIAATLMFHNFWASAPAQVVAQTVNFTKNLGLIGLFAMIATFGAGRYSVDATRGR